MSLNLCRTKSVVYAIACIKIEMYKTAFEMGQMYFNVYESYTCNGRNLVKVKRVSSTQIYENLHKSIDNVSTFFQVGHVKTLSIYERTLNRCLGKECYKITNILV